MDVYSKLEENCELRGTDNVQRQISSIPVFSPQMQAIVFILFQSFFHNARSFENWRINKQ